MITIKFPSQGGSLDIELTGDGPLDLVNAYTQLGGNAQFLKETIMAAVADHQANEAQANLAPLGATAVDPTSAAPTTGYSNQAARTAPATTIPSDPWGAEADNPGAAAGASPQTQSGQTSNLPNNVADPWSGNGNGQNAAPAQNRQEPASTVGAVVSSDKFGREWTMGLADAPNCDHGMPAARMKARSQAGKAYTAWKCALAAGADWQNKCEFSEFVAH